MNCLRSLNFPQVSIHIRRRGRPNDENGRQSYADIRRYLADEGIPETVANSFIRLARNSRYREEQGDFVFTSCHTHHTEPRLRSLAARIGVEWTKKGDRWNYEKQFHWIVSGKHGEVLMGSLTELVFPEL